MVVMVIVVVVEREKDERVYIPVDGGCRLERGNCKDRRGQL